MEEVNAENWEEKYYEVLEKNNGGIVYVKADGTYDYYADYDAFAAAKPELVADNLESYIGQDMTLEKVLCNFGVDDKGNLTSNQITVNFNTTDQDGEHHTLVITGDVTISNYGTTTVQPLDVGTGRNTREASAEAESRLIPSRAKPRRPRASGVVLPSQVLWTAGKEHRIWIPF